MCYSTMVNDPNKTMGFWTSKTPILVSKKCFYSDLEMNDHMIKAIPKIYKMQLIVNQTHDITIVAWRDSTANTRT